MVLTKGLSCSCCQMVPRAGAPSEDSVKLQVCSHVCCFSWDARSRYGLAEHFISLHGLPHGQLGLPYNMAISVYLNFLLGGWLPLERVFYNAKGESARLFMG